MTKATKTILHVIDTTGPGGAETVFLELAQKLTLSGFSNLALIKGEGWVADQLRARKVEFLIQKPFGFLSIPYYWQLLKLMKSRNVALVQAHLLGSILSCAIVCWFLRIPLVATFHGQVDINPSERHTWIKRLLIRFGVSQLVAVSDNLARYIESRGVCGAGEIVTIYNGVDTNRYSCFAKGWLRSQLGISSAATIVGSLGNVRPAKNYHLLLKVAAQLNATPERDVHFVIAGHQKEPLFGELQSLAAQLNITHKIHWLGFLNDTADFLSEIDVFMLCSSAEGFSIATIEALASGKPCIATRCGGPEEIIDDAQCGLLVANNDQSALARGLESLIDDSNLRLKLAEAGRKKVDERFSFVGMANSYSKLYMSYLQDKQ